MVKCAIKGCTNYQGKKGESRILRFFSFPKNAKQSKEWMIVCGQDVNVDIKIARICSKHFGDNEWKLQDVLLNIPIHKRSLKQGAIPSLYLPELETQEVADVEELSTKQSREELVEEAISDYERKKNLELSNNFDEGSWNELNLEDNELNPEEEYHLRRENKILRFQIKRLTKRLDETRNLKSSIKRMFTKSQIKRVNNPHKKYKWSCEEMDYAASLYTAGSTAYSQLVKLNYPLPTRKLMKKWSAEINLRPGLIDNIVKLLSERTCVTEERLCILSFHEIILNQSSYEESTEGGIIVKCAQVVIVRSLMCEWKHIIYWNYDCNNIVEVLKDIIRTLKRINFTVIGIISGSGHWKLHLFAEFKVDHLHPYIEVIAGEKVFFFANVPPLIKHFRNQFADTGFIVQECLLNADPLKELLHPDMPDLELNFKLTEAHLSAKKSIRQNVELAYELFTHQVADALRKCISMGKIHSENALQCSDLIQLFADWLDIFNSKSSRDDCMKQLLCYGYEQEQQHAVIGLMDDLMRNISRGKSKLMFPSQRGILLNNASLMALREHLREKYTIDYLIANQFNQDDLEVALKIRRPDNVGGQPTALEIKYRINLAVQNSLSGNQGK